MFRASQLELSSYLLSQNDHTREQEEKMKFESQIFVTTSRFKENWSCPVVTIKSVTNATALDS
jgi:hypothetical protein